MFIVYNFTHVINQLINERIRSEKKFDSVEELIENIKKDVEFAKKLFTKDEII